MRVARGWVLCLLLWVVLDAQAGLSVRLERDRVTEGETVRLLVEADRQVSDRPDTSPLTKDFDILGISSGSQVHIINGRMQARTTWTITLAPKRQGKLTVPPLELDGERSQALTLEVSAASAEASADRPIFIETEVDRAEPYVQGMVRYTLRLYYGVPLVQGSLSEPRADKLAVYNIGEDRKYQTERDGRRYEVIERQYALFPQASGELVVPAPVLDGQVQDRRARRRGPFDDPFFRGSPLDGMLSATRPVRVRGEAQTLRVRPLPEQAQGGHWLPAEQVELSENWQPQNGELRVGEPVTRTVTIRARGIAGEQLPDVEFKKLKGFKIYPDQARSETRASTQTVAGEKHREFAFVPLQAGTWTLPAVRLHWWDTGADRARVAELPARTVTILPAPGAQNHAPPPAAVPAAAPEAPVSSTANADSDVVSGPKGIWPWISAAFAVLWLLTLGLWWRGSRVYSPRSEQDVVTPMSSVEAGRARQDFLAACRANDAGGARRYLLAWAAAHWPLDAPAGLDDLARRVPDPVVREALAELDRALYRGDAAAWDGRVLGRSLSRLPAANTQQARPGSLPELYA